MRVETQKNFIFFSIPDFNGRDDFALKMFQKVFFLLDQNWFKIVPKACGINLKSYRPSPVLLKSPKNKLLKTAENSTTTTKKIKEK
jgi:hypothetical protein